MTAKPSVYLVDDEESMRLAVGQWLEIADYPVRLFSRARQALTGIDSDFAGVLVTDVRMPDMDGLALMHKTLEIDHEIPVVLITAHGDIPMAVAAMRQGAYDFIEKPFEPDILLEIIRRAVEKRQLILENRNLKKQLQASTGIESQLIGNSEAVSFMRREIHALAATSASVFLVGETGCGKEVAARCLHELSSRNQGDFIAINCGAIPEGLFESELFGHEAGAFSGATGRRIGKFERAHRGTLFLDEINNMPLNLQVKALRVLQEREVERLGGNKTIPVDIRIISATNVEPALALQDGSLRKDLYYRLNVAEIRVPPLRDRNQDILLLFDWFTLRAAERYDRQCPPLANGDIAALMAYSWPGNVRELKNVAERYVLSSLVPEKRLTQILHQGSPDRESPSGVSLADQAAFFERCLIDRSLRRHQGNIQLVMADLQLPRRTLNQKMQNHGLSRIQYLS